jgi:twitching motility protein PilJ
MESTTTEVVSGAKLAEDAGESLHEIEEVSREIAGITKSISDSAGEQARQAGNISDTMSVIQEITTQTTEGTNHTAESIGTLAELADDLRESVAGFRLPEA